MRLYHKLILFMLAAAIGPLVAVGFTLLRASERELKERIGAQQSTAAEGVARVAGRDVEDAVNVLVRNASTLRWSELSPDERLGALKLVFEQSALFSAAALVDLQGNDVAPVVVEGVTGGLARQVSLGPDDVPAFRAALPLGDLKGQPSGTVAMSAVYARPKAGAAAAAVAMALDGVQGRWFIAVEVSLAALQAEAAALSQGGAGALYVLDGSYRFIAAPSADELLKVAPDSDRAAAAGAALEAKATRYEVAGAPVLASLARTPSALGWTVLIRVPEAEAFAPVARMRRAVLASIGGALLLLLVAGLFFTRSLTRGLERVSDGARAYGRGDLTVRLPADGQDELAELARTFNGMGEELHRARQKLETFNEELQQKVEERTAELKAAQAQLLETQKLAAIGQLGAGVAHEINNPLAGILGHAQLMMLDRAPEDPLVPMIKKIENQARRAKEITTNLLRFSQHRASSDLRQTDVNKIVTDALSLIENQVRGEGIEVKVELAEGLPAIKGDASHLSQVVLNLIANSRTAMTKSAKKVLTLRTGQGEQGVFFEVQDSGKGISEKNLPRIFEPFFTTKDVWTNVGLGLSVSYRIVQEHGGKIRAQSQEGQGATLTVELPRASDAPSAPSPVKVAVAPGNEAMK